MNDYTGVQIIAGAIIGAIIGNVLGSMICDAIERWFERKEK